MTRGAWDVSCQAHIHTHRWRVRRHAPTPYAPRGLRRCERAPEDELLQLRQVSQRLGYCRASVSAQVVFLHTEWIGRGRKAQREGRGW